MYKKRDPIWSTCPKTNLRLGNECSRLKIFSGQNLGRYRCKSQVKRQYEVKISKRENWKSDSRFKFLAKKFQWKCFSFFDFPTRTWSDLMLKFIFRSNMLFCLKFDLFQCLMIILTMIQMEYQKKIDTFFQQFFGSFLAVF